MVYRQHRARPGFMQSFCQFEAVYFISVNSMCVKFISSVIYWHVIMAMGESAAIRMKNASQSHDDWLLGAKVNYACAAEARKYSRRMCEALRKQLDPRDLQERETQTDRARLPLPTDRFDSNLFLTFVLEALSLNIKHASTTLPMS